MQAQAAEFFGCAGQFCCIFGGKFQQPVHSTLSKKAVNQTRERLIYSYLVSPQMSASIHIPREFCGLASCDRNFLAGQGFVHGDRKIASQLSPVLMAIGPSPKLVGYRTGAEVGYVDLR